MIYVVDHISPNVPTDDEMIPCDTIEEAREYVEQVLQNYANQGIVLRKIGLDNYAEKPDRGRMVYIVGSGA